MEEFKGKSNQELKEELNNLNEMQEFLKDEIDDEDMKKEYDDNQEKIDYLTKVVSDEPISVPEPSSEPQMDETILVSEKEMGKPKDIKVPEIPKDLFFADGGITKKYFVPRYVKDKISPNFLNVYIDYPTPSGVQVAYGKETMSGQQRRLGSEKAMKLAKEIVEDIKNKYGENLEDIDYFDNERGKVTIFAVSDDFEDTNFALGGYLASAGIGAYYGAKNPKSVKKVTDPIDKAISQIGKNLTDKKYAKGGEVEFRKLANSKNFDIVTPDGRYEIEMGAFGIPKSIIDGDTRKDINTNPIAIKYRGEIQEYIDANSFSKYAKGGKLSSDDKKSIDEFIEEDISMSDKYDDMGLDTPDYEEYATEITGQEIVDKSKKKDVLKYIKSTLGKRDEYMEDYAKGGKIKVGDYVTVDAGYGMKHTGKVNSKHHLHNDRVYVDGIGDALEIKRLTKVKPPSMADGGKIDEKRERVIDYFINNEEEEELISRMGGNGEEFLEDRDGNYDEIYERINDNYNNEDIDELFNEYLGYAKGGELDDILGKLDKVRNEFVDLKLKSDLNTEEGVAKFRKKAEPLKKQERKLEDKLEQMGEQEYSLPFAKGGMTGFNKFFDKFKRSDAYISEPMKTAKGNYRVEVDPYDKETSKKMKDYMQSEGIGYSPKPMGKGFYTQFAKGGKLRNTEYNLRTFFTFDGEDFAIFGGHLYGAREGDNEFMLIDNINYAPKEVQVAYYEKMKGFAKGGTTKDYSYDYEDIGQFSMNRESWGNYTNKQFEKIGKDIVENDYDGNIKKAYDSIVRKTLYPKKFAKGGRVRYMLNGFEENLNYILDSTNGVEVAREGSKEDGDLVIYFETKDEDYAKGGETASPITNYHKNFMGTLSFDLKVKGMRKPQDFIVYPITGKTNIIRIQSDKKWGEIDVTTGKGILSKTGNNSWAFALDVSNRNVNKFDLTPEELEELKSKIRETSGKEVGNVIITTDNSGAELLEEGGVLDMNEVEIYEGPDDNYTIVMKGDVYGMNTQTLPNLSINMYEGDRSEYPSDISHWGKKMKFDDAPIVIKEKIEMRKEEYKEGGRIMSEKDEDIEVMERLIADEKDEDIKIELQKELEKLKNK